MRGMRSKEGGGLLCVVLQMRRSAAAMSTMRADKAWFGWYARYAKYGARGATLRVICELRVVANYAWYEAVTGVCVKSEVCEV